MMPAARIDSSNIWYRIAPDPQSPPAPEEPGRASGSCKLPQLH